MIAVPCSGRGLRHQKTDLFELDDTTLKIISSLSILVPLTWNGWRIKKSGAFGRIFFCFLLLGLLTDLSLWYVHASGVDVDPRYLFNVYALIEGLFFFWLIRVLAPTPNFRRIAECFLVATPFAWCLVLAAPVISSGSTQTMPFVVYYEIAASFLGGFVLLALAENDSQLWTSSGFWFLLGVFFYCFCTFFVMTFLGKELVFNLWPLNNIINMLTYLFYTLGWWLYGRNRLDSAVHRP